MSTSGPFAKTGWSSKQVRYTARMVLEGIVLTASASFDQLRAHALPPPKEAFARALVRRAEKKSARAPSAAGRHTSTIPCSVWQPVSVLLAVGVKLGFLALWDQ